MRPISDYSIRECADLILRGVDVQGITCPIHEAAARLATRIVEECEITPPGHIVQLPLGGPSLIRCPKCDHFGIHYDLRCRSFICLMEGCHAAWTLHVPEITAQDYESTIAALTAERDQAIKTTSTLRDALEGLLSFGNYPPRTMCANRIRWIVAIETARAALAAKGGVGQ